MWKGGIPKCIDCGEQTGGYKTTRCDPCYRKHNLGENHHGWKGGNPKCKYCNKQLSKRYIDKCWKCWLEYESIKTWSIRPTNPEKIIQRILAKYFPKEWKYVGNGKVWFGKKNPDFININGQKKLIEVYGDYWHRNDNPQDRIDHFKKYGLIL